MNDYATGSEFDSANYSIDYCYRVSAIPNSYKVAMKSPDCNKWMEAMNEEMKALNENKTYELITLPNGKAVIGGRWLYAIQPGPNN